MQEAAALASFLRLLEVHYVEEVAVVRFTCPRLEDEDTAFAVEDRLSRLAAPAGKNRVVLDFEGVRSVSSVIVGKLLGFSRKLSRVGGRLALCAVGPNVYNLLERTQLLKLFRVFPSRQEALLAL